MPTERIHQLPPLPARPKDAHKGVFGRVVVIGGSDSMLGAPVLAATAALRMGSGLVYLAMPKNLLPAAISVTPELVGIMLAPSRVDRALKDAIDSADAIVVGPGMGQSAQAKARLRQLLKREIPAVIDADALNLLASERRIPKMSLRAVLTPHPGEMQRLARHFKRSKVPADDAGRIAIATLAAKSFGQIIVLKGAGTVVTDEKRVYINRTGDSTLAKGGSGDVLSGIIASLVGQGMTPFDAACAGVWIHGRAGEMAGRTVGSRFAIARDVIAAIDAASGEYSKLFG